MLSDILYSAILVSTILNKKNFTHSIWLNFMMAAILNSAMLDSDTVILDSDTLLSSLRFTQKHWHATQTLTQINSIWLKLIHSYLTWWWQPSWILPSWIQQFCPKVWLKLIQSDSNSFILTQLEMCAILISAILDSAILHKTTSLNSGTLLSSLRFTQKHSHSTLTLTQTNSFSLNLMVAAIFNSAILNFAILDSAIKVFSLQLTHTCQDWFPPFAQKKLHSFILTNLDDGSHLEFFNVRFRYCHLGFRHLVIFSQIHSKRLSLHSESDSN